MGAGGGQEEDKEERGGERREEKKNKQTNSHTNHGYFKVTSDDYNREIKGEKKICITKL